MIYLDHNATTAPAPEVIEQMLEVLQRVWANPSSTHGPGQDARRVLADARVRVARFLGCGGPELVFTSGATESNHAALRGALAARRAEGRHRLLVSAVEHAGLLDLAARLRLDGITVDTLPVRGDGALDLAAARSMMGEDVALVSVMAANNETGVLMPTDELAVMAQAYGAWLHVDATQIVGKQPWRFDDSGAQLASVSAHKLHGPKGVGALLVRRGLTIPPLVGGKQERNRRGGTENLPGIAGFAAAADLAAAHLAREASHMAGLRDRLEAGLQAMFDAVHVYAQGLPRLVNTSCLRFGELDAEQVLGKLERAGIVASSGAACSAGGTQPSHVLDRKSVV
jgi:cysteine desulfurase